MTTEGQPWRDADEAMSCYARGDDRAFGAVYDVVAPRLEAYLRRHLGDGALIEDTIQHTFLQMHGKRGSFSPGAEVLPWAFSIARNFMIDVKRKARREASGDAPEDVAAMSTFLIAALPDAEAIIQARQTSERLLAAFAACTEHQRAAFELTRGDGLSQAQAAQVLGTTVMAIKQCTHKVYEKLRAVLTDGREGPRSSELAEPATPPPATL
jgi:RNA polymerase sigma-70 factor (ECF subfamily)